MQRDATVQKLLLGGGVALLALPLLSVRVLIALLFGAAAGAAGSLLLRAPSTFEPVSTFARARESDVDDVKPAPSGQKLSLPGPLVQPVDRLAELIVRDFITVRGRRYRRHADSAQLWYRRSISLGDERFVNESRYALNAFVNALSARLARCDTREAGVFMLHSVSQALIAEMRANGEDGRTTPLDVGAAQRKVRAACEELLGGLAPRSAMAAPAASALLAEILTLVVWQIVTALDADWMNQTILAALKEAPAIESKLAAAAEAMPVEPLVAQPTPVAESTPRQSLDAPSLRARSASPSVLSPRAALQTCLDGSKVASEAALSRLASEWPLDSLASPPAPPTDLVRALRGDDNAIDLFPVRCRR